MQRPGIVQTFDDTLAVLLQAVFLVGCGLGDVDVLLDTVIKSVGDRVEKKHISAMEKKVNETHSLVMLMYKHMTEQQEALERLKMDVKAGAPRAKGDFTAPSTSGADIPRALGGHN